MAFGIPMPTIASLLSLLVPIVYLTILVGSLATFSSLYRRRQTNSKLKLAPYFPSHTARNVYLTLLHQTDTQSDLKSVPNSVLCAALLERACEDILRLREINTRKGPLNTLLQRGVVGDDVWQRFLRADKELEAELKDVLAEANALAPGWGENNLILQTANEIIVNRLTKAKIEEKRATLASEKEAWEKVKEASRLELEGEFEPKKEVVSASSTNASTPEKARPKAAAVTEASDEDTVLVEKGADAVTSTSGGGGKNKKKKGKK